jgi:hypothetical protein
MPGCSRLACRLWRLVPSLAMRVSHGILNGCPHRAFPKQDPPFQTVPLMLRTKRSAYAFRFGLSAGNVSDSTPASVGVRRKLSVNSGSPIMDQVPLARGQAVTRVGQIAAIWVIHKPFATAEIPPISIGRVASSTKNSTTNRCRPFASPSPEGIANTPSSKRLAQTANPSRSQYEDCDPVSSPVEEDTKGVGQKRPTANDRALALIAHRSYAVCRWAPGTDTLARWPRNVAPCTPEWSAFALHPAI